MSCGLLWLWQAMHVSKRRKIRGWNDRFWHWLRLSGRAGKHIKRSCRRTALRNRQTLKFYMQGAGFRPYAREWWHFELINEPFYRGGFDFEVSASPSSTERPTR